jgi:hypothetical protein
VMQGNIHGSPRTLKRQQNQAGDHDESGREET